MLVQSTFITEQQGSWQVLFLHGPTKYASIKEAVNLARGFYAGNGPALAAAWAHGRYPSQPGVLADNRTSSYAAIGKPRFSCANADPWAQNKSIANHF
jgi:hypothetical protein